MSETICDHQRKWRTSCVIEIQHWLSPGWPSTPGRGVTKETTREQAVSSEVRSRETGQTKIHIEARRLTNEMVSNSCNEIEAHEVIEIVSAVGKSKKSSACGLFHWPSPTIRSTSHLRSCPSDPAVRSTSLHASSIINSLILSGIG